jgi:energy-coupling factor transport system permease protein
MKAAALAVWATAGVALSLSTANPVYRGLVAIIGLNVVLGLRRHDARLRPLATGLAIAAAIAVLVNLLLSHGGSHVLVRVPETVPFVGGPLTLEAAAYGVQTGLGMVATCLCVAPLAMVVEPQELADALPRALRRSGAAIAGALELLPRLHRNAVAIAEAQRMRGWQPRGPGGWADVIVPVVVGAVEDSVERAEALEARGYGTGRATSWGERRWRAGEIAVAVAALAAIAIGLTEVIRGAAGDWYPLPSLALPAVDVPFVLACLLLGTPLLTWRR